MHLRIDTELVVFVLKPKFGLLLACLSKLGPGLRTPFILATVINKEIRETNTSFLAF